MLKAWLPTEATIPATIKHNNSNIPFYMHPFNASNKKDVAPGQKQDNKNNSSYNQIEFALFTH